MMERWFSGSTVAAPAIFATVHHRPEVDDTCAGPLELWVTGALEETEHRADCRQPALVVWGPAHR